MVLYATMSAAALGITLLDPLIVAAIMNRLQQHGLNRETLAQLWPYLLGWFAVTPAFWAFHGPSRVIERITAFRIRSSYQQSLFGMATAMPYQWHRDNHSGITTDRINRASQSLMEFCETSFEVIHTAVRYCGPVIILCVLMPAAGFVLAASSIAVLLVIVNFDRRLFAIYSTINGRMNLIAEAVTDYLANIRTVITLRLGASACKEVSNRLENTAEVVVSGAKLQEVKWFLANLLIAATTVLTFGGYLGYKLQLDEPLQMGTCYLLLEYLRRIAEAFFTFAWKWGDLVKMSANVRAVEGLEQSFHAARTGATAARLPASWKRLDIANVNFGYDDEGGERRQLQDASFTLERGRSYAFIGESGSGKSTMLALLRALHRCSSATVLCNGRLIPGGLEAIASTTTLIPQDPELFADTVRRNIALDFPVEEQQVVEALEQARFLPVAERLPKGLNTNIAERGVNLSGGEKQRLALARGVLFAAESEILLLDEPTSSVDPVNEREIYENILRNFKDRCVVSAVHRLHLLRLFDEIVVFSGGRIVESGPLEELLKKNGECRRLWEHAHRERAVEKRESMVFA